MRSLRAIPVGFREVEGTPNQWNMWFSKSFTYVLLQYLGYLTLSIPFDDSNNHWTVQRFLTEWICMIAAENITKLVLKDKGPGRPAGNFISATTMAAAFENTQENRSWAPISKTVTKIASKYVLWEISTVLLRKLPYGLEALPMHF